ncbi:P-loop containing nucleoside triphosphate hydrolase protein [Fennellomyces sp. T-0311]|nr:P-loop containing nucleoside triphosphate hydrolase protein [Fennellomyces sp. T-0311]
MKSAVEPIKKSRSIPVKSSAQATTQPKKQPLSTANNNIRKTATMLSSKRKSNEKEPPRSTRPRVDTGKSAVKKPIKSNENAKAPQQRPSWDHRGKLSDMEESRKANETRIAELSKSWQDLEDDVANKESQSREVNQRLFELQTMCEAAKRTHADAVDQLNAQFQKENQALEESDKNLQTTTSDLQDGLSDIQMKIQDGSTQSQQREAENAALRETISNRSVSIAQLTADLTSFKAQFEATDKKLVERQRKIEDLQKEKQNIHKMRREHELKLLDNEKIRRQLHNTIQELKGNIRVFCRVRPALESEKAREGGLAQVRYYGEDNERLEFTETTSSTLGRTTVKGYPFSFDRVFTPDTTQKECFEEISQLVQSALDGYNVCIFAYGQTGSGKTFTMQGPSGPNTESAGMIPRAVQQIYEVTQKLKDRKWTYTMEGQFLEIYNETVHDLLGDTSNYGKIKHEIRHEKNGRTTVTDMSTVILDSPAKVNMMLRKASHNRATGATNLNERSSRSHSVFMLRLTGSNSATNEQCSGVLNLIDLAGSERLAQSGSTGDRLRETQAINKSLSCLGDVIHALANNKDGGHVPFRNSKLTYLLQNSLGGNSKTLMFVNVSPLSEHFGETLCSLRFATKVNSCRIAPAKKLRV